MKCCDGNCNQGRNCPMRVAKVKQRYAKYPEGKYVPYLTRQLKALAKWMLLALVAWMIWVPLALVAWMIWVPLLYLALRA